VGEAELLDGFLRLWGSDGIFTPPFLAMIGDRGSRQQSIATRTINQAVPPMHNDERTTVSQKNLV
jgi:hypothetical protein